MSVLCRAQASVLLFAFLVSESLQCPGRRVVMMRALEAIVGPEEAERLFVEVEEAIDGDEGTDGVEGGGSERRTGGERAESGDGGSRRRVRLLTAAFDSKTVGKARDRELRSEDVARRPDRLDLASAREDATYLVMLVYMKLSPNGTEGTALHWAVSDVPGRDLARGDVQAILASGREVAPYVSPGSLGDEEAQSDLSIYFFFAAVQPREQDVKQDVEEIPFEARQNFSVVDYLRSRWTTIPQLEGVGMFVVGRKGTSDEPEVEWEETRQEVMDDAGQEQRDAERAAGGQVTDLMGGNGAATTFRLGWPSASLFMSQSLKLSKVPP